MVSDLLHLWSVFITLWLTFITFIVSITLQRLIITFMGEHICHLINDAR